MISITHYHKVPYEDLPGKVCDVVSSLESELSLRAWWRGDFLAIEFEATQGMAKGVEGTLELGRSHITLAVRLPFMLRPMSGMIEDKIKSVLVRELGESCEVTP